ncbi:cyclin-G-associated kinase-like [Paramuricea clavata]|uniref:Cyclin-G-associated kinase-like n=1 Tax=Paramuricea clavata TaxID=317549 RepID=A0A7D9DPS3_PARCT|nr:cyclin-G-associated kinase-like [Paramuricea clavata]
MADIFRSAFGIFSGNKTDSDFVGQRVDIASTQLRVKKLIAEGAYGFVFVAQDVSSGKEYALKRLMAADDAANKAIIQEITFMKRLRGHPNIVQFLNAASIGAEESDNGMAEFLILTELCTGGQLIKWFNDRQGKRIPATQILRIFHQICRAVAHMHKQSPPIIHRDLKIENLLLSSRGQIKLCDFGSATTKSLYPSDSWTSVERSLLEDEMQRNTTPMYRAPEMVDLYSNYPITVKSDIWALGCLLYMLCYMEHPFEDGAKLRILNAKFTLPEFDKEYDIFHSLICKMLQADPTKRPEISEVVSDLESIALSRYVELKGSIFQEEEPMMSTSQDNTDQAGGSSAVFGGVVKGAGTFFSNIKDMSNKVVQSVAGYVKSDLDISYVTSRVLVMPIPGEGIESTYKNSVDDVQIFLDTKHPSKFAVVNLSQRPAKLKGKGTDDVNRHIKETVSPAILLCGTSVFDTLVICMLLGKESAV